MNRGYVRAHLERAEEGKPLRFVAATEGRKGDGIDLRMSGAELERFQANPVFGFGHSYWGRSNLPIGRAASVEVDGDQLVMEVEFDQADEFACEVERKYRGRYLNAVSIGFDVREWENENDNYWRGGVATSWELIEVSAVPIPMDAGAVVESGRSLYGEFETLVAATPADPSVVVARDSVSLTRSVTVSEQLIQRADPLRLAVTIGRALAMSPAEPTPVELTGVPDPEAERLRAELAEVIRERDELRDAATVAPEPVGDPPEPDVAPDDVERLLAAFS